MKTMWKDDSIQFPRLLAELRAIGLTEEQYASLVVSMDLKRTDIDELFDRSADLWSVLLNIFDVWVIRQSVFSSMYWGNDSGWGELAKADRFSKTQKDALRFEVPIAGVWVPDPRELASDTTMNEEVTPC
jgi:hypothetical protein